MIIVDPMSADNRAPQALPCGRLKGYA